MTSGKEKKESRLCYPDSIFINQDLLMGFASDNGVKSTQVFWPRDIQGFEKSPFSTQPKGKNKLPKGRFAPPVLGRAVWSIFSFACNTLYLPQGRPSGPQMWPLGPEESGRDSTTELLVLTPMSQPPGPVLGAPGRTPLRAFPTLEPAFLAINLRKGANWKGVFRFKFRVSSSKTDSGNHSENKYFFGECFLFF